MFVNFRIPVVNTDYDNSHYDYEGEIPVNVAIENYRRKKDVDIKYTYTDTKAFVWDKNKKDIDEFYIEDVFEKGGKTILVISIDPNSIDFNACEELKSWIIESNLIWDSKVENKTKIQVLPRLNFEIIPDGSGNKYTLRDSILVEDYSNEKSAHYFAIMTDKILKNV